jgi:hypothetical protein
MTSRQPPGFAGESMRLRHRFLIPLLLGILVLASPHAATAQIDGQERTYLEAGAATPLVGNGSADGYLFVLLNRPHFTAEDLYWRIVVSPLYINTELIHDRWPADGHALGVGLSGGLLGNNFSEYRDGDYKRRESFWGHGGGLSLSYYWRQIKIGGVLPVEGQLRLKPQYIIYDTGFDTAHRFRLPDDTAIYTGRAGIRVGGVPPEIFPKQALEVSVWHEANYRDQAGRYGLPERPQESEHFTQRSWARVGGIFSPWLGHSVSLFATGGIAEDTDELSVFRLGGVFRFASELPLSIHGYNSGEIFAKRFGLINASYRFAPVPGVRWFQLQLAGDYARVHYLAGHTLPHRDLPGAGLDAIFAFSQNTTLLLGYGYAFEVPRGGHTGGQEVHALFEIKL